MNESKCVLCTFAYVCVCVRGGGDACHREASQSALIWVPLTFRGTPVSAERRLPVLAATQSLPADTWIATVDLVLKLCHYWSTLSPDSLHKKLSCSFLCQTQWSLYYGTHFNHCVMFHVFRFFRFDAGLLCFCIILDKTIHLTCTAAKSPSYMYINGNYLHLVHAFLFWVVVICIFWINCQMFLFSLSALVWVFSSRKQLFSLKKRLYRAVSMI